MGYYEDMCEAHEAIRKLRRAIARGLQIRGHGSGCDYGRRGMLCTCGNWEIKDELLAAIDQTSVYDDYEGIDWKEPEVARD